MKFIGIIWITLQFFDSTDELRTSRDGTCTLGWFKCLGTTECLPKHFRCDGDTDCADKSDEVNCTTIHCALGGFQCADGQCIPGSFACDGDSDCLDKSDETNCTKRECSEDQFDCLNGFCIANTKHCDGQRDCPDGLDERNCTSTRAVAANARLEACSGFRCVNDGRCILKAFVCDDDTDCTDGSDEQNCTSRPLSSRQCPSQRPFKCRSDSRCLPRNFVCDDDRDCADASDEENCSNKIVATCPAPRSFRCHGTNFTFCIQSSFVCDGDNDCLNGSDEQDCPTKNATHEDSLCASGYFNCYHGLRVALKLCMPIAYRCNGVINCVTGFDERNCPTQTKCSSAQFACADSVFCIPRHYVCDGDSDCMDGSDERNCTTRTRIIGGNWRHCPVTYFQCVDTHRCIAQHYVCDNDRDCSDGSDEANCTSTIPTLTTGCINGSNCSEALEQDSEYSCESGIVCDGICITNEQQCNSIRDCPDGRDEANCNCTSSTLQFRCANGQCIPRGLVCDEVNDCNDGSDESVDVCLGLRRRRPTLQTTVSRCQPNMFMCANRTCISVEHLCNGKKDCADGSDEGGHCEQRECRSSPCGHNCHESPSGYQCSCEAGFELASDRHSCQDIDECLNLTSHCAHYCRNTIGSYICSCEAGYAASTDGRECTLEEPDVILLFAERRRIRSVSVDRSSLASYRISDVISARGHHPIRGLSFDSAFKTIYWSEPAAIWKMSIEGSVAKSDPESVSTKLHEPNHLAVDWRTRNMYLVESNRRLVACNANISRCTDLAVPSQLNHIRSLTLVANEGLMFLSYWAGDMDNIATGGVIRSQMDGTAQTQILVNMTMKPSHLQVDFIHRRLYVFDQQLQVIEHFDYNGDDRKPLYQGHSMHAFALSPSSIYWAEGSQIFKGDGILAQGFVTVAPGARASVMTVMHRVRQPARVNPCNKHRCEHLCLQNSFGAVCACETAFQLNVDGRTCRPSTEEGLSERRAAPPSSLCSPPCSDKGSCVLELETNQPVCMCKYGFSGESCEDANGPQAIWILTGLIFIVLLTYMVLKVGPRAYRYSSTLYHRGMTVAMNPTEPCPEMESSLITAAAPPAVRPTSCELNEM